MRIVDVGAGPTVVLIPGIQGRWEWMRPTVDALARHCRVITFSLADEPTCGAPFDAARGFDCYVEQVRLAMDAAGVESSAICGVSYGGLIAAAFAARYPEKTTALTLASAIPPSWRPDARVRFYLRAPRLLSPLFCIASVRMFKEIAAANTSVLTSVAAAARHAVTATAHLFSPSLMARRVHFVERLDLARELTSVRVPVLVITGEPALDRVVPVARTREYLELWPHATAALLPRTGHLGLITRPQAFAELVAPFVAAAGRAGEAADGGVSSRRRIG